MFPTVQGLVLKAIQLTFFLFQDIFIAFPSKLKHEPVSALSCLLFFVYCWTLLSVLDNSVMKRLWAAFFQTLYPLCHFHIRLLKLLCKSIVEVR